MTDIISKTASILFFLVAICVVSSSSSSSSDCAIDSSTVCKFANQSLACCHAKDATCCESGEYCCPRGFQCDVANGRCVQDDMYIPFYLKLDLLVEHPLGKDILCPDNVTTCKEKQTCCNMTAGGYGCCPIRDAHCCEDGVHCCPKNYKCNPSQGKCDRNKTMHDAVADLFSPNSIDWLKKELGSRASVPCPGGTAECPTGSTCCQLNSGQWGCCPLPNAVCCDDHIHCCPNGYVCDVKDGRCNKQNEFVEMVKKMPAYHKPAPAPPKDDHIAGLGDYSVQCPDGCSFCPNGNTCCKMSDGSYGCCPLPKAVCCEDHLHCCPQNTRCNMAQQTCESTESNYTSTWLKKVPAKSRLDDTQVKTLQTDPVLCGDGKTECDPLKVCCKLPDNTFGCCPYVDGICCPGEAYCCPNDMICGNSTGECIPKPDESTTVTKFTNVVKNTAVSACQLDPPSEPTQQQCSSNSTACKNLNDQVVCCMYANGVCCGKDGLCCPNGYTCDEANEACQLNDDVVREPVQLLLADECDDVTAGAATTPCQTGCCASQNAVCCSDGLNCCPNGYSCSTSNDDSSLKCVKN